MQTTSARGGQLTSRQVPVISGCNRLTALLLPAADHGRKWH